MKPRSCAATTLQKYTPMFVGEVYGPLGAPYNPRLSIGRCVLGSVSASKKRHVWYAIPYSTTFCRLVSPDELAFVCVAADADLTPTKLLVLMAASSMIHKNTCFNFKIVLLDICLSKAVTPAREAGMPASLDTLSITPWG